jgi:hypothetical protein
MIEGTVPLTGRKRSVWWVDPRLVQPFVPSRWIAPPLLAANLLLALPDEWRPAFAAGDRFEAIAGGLALGAVLTFLPRGVRAGGTGARRVLHIAAMATSLATLAMLARDAVQGFSEGYGGAVAPSAPPVRGWAFFATYLFGSLVVGLVLDQVDRRRAREAQQARQLREARDAALRARLAPHFIFNALGTLQAQIEKDPAAATDTADRLARLFRQALAAAGRPLVPIREELDFVEAYLGIERSRLGDRLRVKVDVPEELEETEIPPLSLQVLVENAVQHGVAPREDGGEIVIRARRSGYGENPGVVLSVDNPLAPSTRPGTGNGLETLRGRLANPGDLTISSSGALFHAEFWWGTA